MIGVIDYGAGNLRSLSVALTKLGRRHEFVDKAELLSQEFSHLLIPGVGSIRNAMTELGNRGFLEAIPRLYAEGQPIVGICLGMQLLFSWSEEDGGTDGLGLIEGQVKAFASRDTGPISRVGWDGVDFAMEGKLSGEYFFAHAFEVIPSDESVIIARANRDSDVELVAAVARDRLLGLQFHPEKSSTLGLACLEWALSQ